jgi:hypothetical protein
MNSDILSEIRRLDFEDLLWVIFAILSILNIYGDYNDKEYLKTNNKMYDDTSSRVFEFTLTVTFFIYLYFLIRNYNAYSKVSAESKNLYLIKLFGSALLIGGVIALIYFQKNENSFIGSPAL